MGAAVAVAGLVLGSTGCGDGTVTPIDPAATAAVPAATPTVAPTSTPKPRTVTRDGAPVYRGYGNLVLVYMVAPDDMETIRYLEYPGTGYCFALYSGYYRGSFVQVDSSQCRLPSADPGE